VDKSLLLAVRYTLLHGGIQQFSLCYAKYTHYQTILQIKAVNSVITSMNYEVVQADNLCKAGTVDLMDKLNPLAPNTEFHQCLLHSLGDKHRA